MPEIEKDSVIIDTNLWISYLLMGENSKVDVLFKNNRIKLIFSQELLDEFIEVAMRPKFRKFFPLADLDELLTAIAKKAILVPVFSIINLCRDPKDNFLLALAKDSNASHLLTGDNDLLELKNIGRTQIITIAEYLDGK